MFSFAARFKAVDCAELLLSHGADANAKDAEGRTPLMVGACNSANAADGEKLFLGEETGEKDESTFAGFS